MNHLFRRRLGDLQSNVRAAIDLASIMVGVIVIGIIGGVISATVFAVIPWSQNEAAKQALASVATAQGAYRLLGDDVYGTAADLAAGERPLLPISDTVCVASDGTNWSAVARSGSDTFWSRTSATPVVTQATESDWADCSGEVAFDPAAAWVVPDTELAAGIRAALGVEEGTQLTLGDAERLTDQEAADAGLWTYGGGAESWAGLEHATNLTAVIGNLTLGMGGPVSCDGLQNIREVTGSVTLFEGVVSADCLPNLESTGGMLDFQAAGVTGGFAHLVTVGGGISWNWAAPIFDMPRLETVGDGFNVERSLDSGKTIAGFNSLRTVGQFWLMAWDQLTVSGFSSLEHVTNGTVIGAGVSLPASFAAAGSIDIY